MTELLTWEEYVRGAAVPREFIDFFLNGANWARFDAELGYTLQNSLMPWGIDGSRTIETVDGNGARSRFMYADRPLRINSYGDSFTESEQTSDGETWQEYLAGHLGEPVGNYGVGGYGLYQAYRRLVRTEPTAPAECVILYCWGDDALRSLLRARWMLIYRWYAAKTGDSWLFHANPWAHIELDLATGSFVEVESPIRTADDLYRLCDPEWMWEHVRDDLATQLWVFADVSGSGRSWKLAGLDREPISALADHFGVPFDWDDPEGSRRSANELLSRYSQAGAVFTLEKAREFTAARGSRLLVALNYTAELAVPSESSERNDQIILDHLEAGGYDYFDMNEVHRRERELFRLPEADYEALYRVGGKGHYNPRGNHLFAYSIKDSVLALLDPKPLPYQEVARADTVDFEGYIPSRQRA